MQREGIENDATQLVGVGENLFHQAAQDLSPRTADKTFRRSAHQDDAGVAGEEHQAVLQRPHDLVEVFF